MSNQVNISINGKQKMVRGRKATLVIFFILALAGVGLLKIVSALYVSLF